MQNIVKAGFTLVELSITLIIIGLIVGGVLVGNELIQGAKMRSLLADVQTMQSGVILFQGKYKALPGDMSNAATYGLGPDGNGNMIYDTWDTGNNAENFGAWAHMAVAGVLPGSYTGVKGTGRRPGVNIPYLKAYPAATTGFYYGNYWATWNDTNSIIIEPVFAGDAQRIDEKTDDGKPFTGKIMSYGTLPACVTTDVATSPNSATKAATTYVQTGDCALNVRLDGKWN